METNPETRQLVTFEVVETTDPLAKALEFGDENGKKEAFIVGPEGLSELIQDLHGLVNHWSEFPSEVARSLAPPENSLAASNIQFGIGREPTEASMLVHSGPVQMTYLLPLSVLIQAISSFAKNVRLVQPPGSPVQ
ncbi:hypothetical protein C7T35_15315 [Variovorax sp. WS11]|uniref:hypothetical protein n=1 Tax=Variovorax sp. WS11 TaxID=1105204 RepID=UPI000D0E16D0|nr:hypothetical protein [Variovorax sp. WS11]NDZ12069.1 hypothetical protein [Variovorax sp. WS11]PSL83750.1 hypothetical protein C7T35_15315 [Variovorax sp. WS11]